MDKLNMELTDVSKRILNYRYLREGETPEERMAAVARVAASAEKAKDRKYWESKFYGELWKTTFLPNTPTLINAGRPLGQFMACFTLPVEDSVEQIFESVKNAALIHKSGGGTGFSFSNLRPCGSFVRDTGGLASGPVSFMRVFDAATHEMKQGGVRRGANMGMLGVWHPDIMEFITCKQAEGASFTNFNISVAITDQFMRCLLDKKPYKLVWEDKIVKTVDPRTIWDAICLGAWQNGEPGIFFVDRVNSRNALNQLECIETANPCCEQPLPSYGSCTLGSIDLGKFVISGVLDIAGLKEVVKLGVRFLDNLIDVNKYPLSEIKLEAEKTRRIGLGIMGLADMLIKCHLRYDSKEGRKAAGAVMKIISDTATLYSVRLGTEKGIPDALKSIGIQRRNGLLTTIAPTGSLSLIAGCSSGCEPLYDTSYLKMWSGGTLNISHTYDESCRPYIVTAKEIPLLDHIDMQVELQKHVDSGISKTVNGEFATAVEDVDEAFQYAYEKGVNSLTFYRDGSRDVESQKSTKENKDAEKQPEIVVSIQEDLEESAVLLKEEVRTLKIRPELLLGKTTQIKTGRGKLYITINEVRGVPFEVFLRIGKSGREDFAYGEALGRLISIAFRSGISVDLIIRQLRGISGDEPIWSAGRLVRSVPDAVSLVLKDLYGSGGEEDSTKRGSIVCPDCGGDNVEIQGNCALCRECGYSKCG